MFLAELVSDSEPEPEEVALLLSGLYTGFSGDGDGMVAVDVRVAVLLVLGVKWVHIDAIVLVLF